MSNQSKYKMRLSLNVLNHLGINLYSNIPSVLSEVIANAWDADATEVDIDIQTKSVSPQITITDNGAGMSTSDINDKFLFVGYNRREHDGDRTPEGRAPMGRKGIGKLSLFSIADTINVYSVQGTKGKEAFQLDAKKIKKAISGEKTEEPTDVPIGEIAFDRTFDQGDGTRIVLTDLKKRIIGTTIPALRKKIARRFAVSCMDKMHVRINGRLITIAERDYFSKLEYVLAYGETEIPRNSCDKLAKDGWHDRHGSFESESGKHTIRGWIGMTVSSKDLAVADGGDNMNKISILMRNKVAVEDVLESFGFGGMFTRFVIGEIHADFLDEGEDIATSSRQKIIEDDVGYQALTRFLKKELESARGIRDDGKRESGEKAAIKFFPKVEEWLNAMPTDTRKKARALLGKIHGMNTDDSNKKDMFRFGIQAFESRRLHDKLDSLDSISAENLEGFLEVASELDELEASYYYQITEERLRVIKKFDEMQEEDVKERILQEYIFKHLWLLDPSWERTDDSARMEEQVKSAFKKVGGENYRTDSAAGRVDIRYRTAAGVHVIVELKRASVSVKKTDLEFQIMKYKNELERCLREAECEKNPAVEVVCVVGTDPVGWENPAVAQRDRDSLKPLNVRVLTYRSLINSAKKAYQDYLREAKKYAKFASMFSDFDDESEGDG